MPRKVETFELDGEHYRVTQLGALEGRRLLVKVSKTLGPMLSRLKLEKKPGKTLVESALEAEVFPALGGFLQELDEGLFDELCQKFAELTEVRVRDRGQENWPTLGSHGGAVFDEHFAGRYGLMVRWFGKCLAINGGDFLSALERMSPPSASVGEASPSRSRPTSTGGSGGSSPTSG
jgi:hypothetical protein